MSDDIFRFVNTALDALGSAIQQISGLDGPFVLPNPRSLVGKPAIGTGQCAAICQSPKTLAIGLTRHWYAGPHVLTDRARIQEGTVIASFICGCYQNMPHDNHVALFLSATADSITVVDQWSGKAPTVRTIRDLGDYTDPSNNARPFHVVYVSKTQVSCPGLLTKQQRDKLHGLNDHKKRWAEIDAITRKCLPAPKVAGDPWS